MEQNQFPKKGNSSFSKKVGDKVERLGEKVSRAGATKVGNAIHNLGDKIEHMGEEEKEDKDPQY